MRTIIFTGAAGPVAAAVITRVAEVMDDVDVRVLAPRPFEIDGVHVDAVDLVGVDLTSFFESGDVVVHLGIAIDDIDPYALVAGRAVDEASAVLEAACASDVDELIIVSSALVLGAIASNPVPLTEAAVVHAAAGFRPAVELAEIERLVAESADAVPTTVLRAAPVVADGHPGWLAAEMHRSLAYPVEDKDPGFQYLHASDLGDAVSTLIDGEFSGLVHVAPDGSLSGPERRALETRPWLRVSERVAHVTATVRSTATGSGTPEGIRPYLGEEWSLANDRAKSLGWEPRHSNEQSYVAAFRAAPWSMIPSGRRQEILLGAVGTIAGAAVVGAGLAWRRRKR